MFEQRYVIPLTGYPKFEVVTPDSPSAFLDQRVRNDEVERLRERVRIEPQGITSLPHRP
jgi:hypothetical protein